MNGLIVKGVGGLYTIYSAGVCYPARARGKFRKDMQKPVIGDYVEFTPANAGEDFGSVDAIAPRRNRLIRPAVANIDVLLTVLASAAPQPDLLLIDKLLLQARRMGLEAQVVINKADLQDAQPYARQYALCGYRTYCVSAQTGEGIDALRAGIRGKVVAYAGQSAVGKSSLLNALCGQEQMQTGAVSRIERGRHTTRHVELLALGEDTWVADTPGFSLLELEMMDPQTLKDFYPEFVPYSEDCRFLGCNHISEPGCAVKAAVQRGALSAARLERYAQLFDECKEKWSRRYD